MSDPSYPLISTTGITKTYRTAEVETTVLHDIDIEIKQGEFVAIMGPSGSGKSTLMHILSFLDTPTSGKYLFAGEDVTGLPDTSLARLRNERIGFVFQSFNLLPRTSVTENVKLPLIYTPKKDKDTLVRKAIQGVGLSHRADNESNQLSGGEKQRVAIARALVNEPDIIFADEPTGNLDSVSGNQILLILQDLNKRGKTVVMVTHELDTAKHAERIIHLKDGQITSDKPVQNRRYAKDGSLKK